MTSPTNSYISGKSQEANAELYKKTLNSSVRYLAYRDIPDLFKKYTISGSALDFGCGTGISCQYLLDHGFEVSGVDLNPQMVKECGVFLPKAMKENIHLVEAGQPLPFEEGTFDLVFSCFVLFEIDSRPNLLQYLQEAKRVLKPGGHLVAITGSQYLYDTRKKWYTFDNNFPENRDRTSGQKVRAKLRDVDIVFEDYFWKDSDYQVQFEKAGLKLVEQLLPKGKSDESYLWQDEITSSPFVIYVLEKV